MTEQRKCYGNIIIPVHCDDIEQLILHKEYKDGDFLPSERVLATQYGVSRNVIREAIKILTEKKLVTNVIGKGNYVTLPNETDLVDMVESALNTSAGASQSLCKDKITQFGGYFYGKKKRQSTKSSNERNDA